MTQIQIDVTPEQMLRLKVLAEAVGKSIGEYILERLLPPDNEAYALESLLKSRIAEAKAGQFANQSVDEIALELFKEMRV